MALNYNGKTYLKAVEEARTQEEENEIQTFRNAIISAINDLKKFVYLPDGKEELIEKANQMLAKHGFGLKRVGDVNKQGTCRYLIEAWDPEAPTQPKAPTEPE